MNKSLFAALIIISLINTSYAQVTVIRAQNPNLAKDYYVFIENADAALRNHIITAFQTTTDVKIFTNPTDNAAPIIISNSKKGLVIDNAGRDCLLGVGACGLSMLFVQATGKELDPNAPPSGFYATVGNKYVQGSAATFTSVVGLAGCVFGIKGIIELFRPKSKKKQIETMLSGSSLTAKGIISNALLIQNSDKTFSNSDSASDIVSYINAQFY